LQTALDAAIERRRHVIVDMRTLCYIDSTGIDVLTACKDRCQAQALLLLIAAPSVMIERVFEILNLSQLIPIFPTGEDALEACGPEAWRSERGHGNTRQPCESDSTGG
jgi:anti-anti-sigma factor